MKANNTPIQKRSLTKLVAVFVIVTINLLIFPGCQEEEVKPVTPPPPTGKLYLDQVYKTVAISQPREYAQGLTFTMYDAPDNEDTQRPLVLLSPGGAWSRYTRTDELKQLCRNLALRGYAVAMVNYSLTTELPGADIWVKSAIDQKNAIRFFKKNADVYKIDANKVFIGGWSTGSLFSMSNGFIASKETTEIKQEELRLSIEEAEAKYTDYNQYTEFSTTIKGVLCLSGWSFELDVFDAGDPAVMLINHVDATLTDGTSIWGEFETGGVKCYGFDLIRDRLIAQGYEEGKNLEYIKMTGPLTMSQYGTVETMSTSNFNQIAAFFYNNMN